MKRLAEQTGAQLLNRESIAPRRFPKDEPAGQEHCWE